MNGPGDIPLPYNLTPDPKPCSFTSIFIPLGMSSCRGRAEAFARSLQTKLRTLGSQNDNDRRSEENELIINGRSSSAWVPSQESQSTITEMQPARRESDSFFDFDCELDSPGSPVDECEYLRLIETASNTPHNSNAKSVASSSSSSSNDHYFDPESSESEQREQHEQRNVLSLSSSVPDCVDSFTPDSLLTENLHNTNIEESLLNDTQDHKIDPSQTNENLKDNKSSSGNTADSFKSHISMIEDLSTALQDEVLKELQIQSNNYTTEHLEKAVTKPKIETTSTVKDLKQEENFEDQMQTFDRIRYHQNLSFGSYILQENTLTQNDSKELEATCFTESKECITKDPSENTEILEIHEKKELYEIQHHDSVLDTDDEDDCRPQRVRRSSSLKTGKTPPGTPGRKKFVRFADVLGLDLADIKTFLDEIPTIPKSAFEDLEILNTESPIQLGPRSDKLLMPLFQQPAGLPNFLDIVREKQVSLENAAVTDHINLTITGTVRVRNLDFHKSVYIRYTLDNWRSFADLQANYVDNSCDGFSDKFAFVLFGNSLNVGQKLELAVRFHCKGQQFWDNNYGANYSFECLPSATPNSQNTVTNPVSFLPIYQSSNNNNATSLNSSAGDSWCNSLY